ncbi:MOSC domain-containing protein [Emericellopsis atlantica]|uniref:MOSC domain-containing protein n=1 Tax=Emericellopsis atlantica TaxID=2614577 RepID=A0A9P7ZWF8_9HYPO|nr:MOSC domain-containing protein [Emericellopsis atlantica]KAG9258951.1 MOSC domain-containing protein [Emericellopsis atlantica]
MKVTALWVYPIKGLRAIPLTSATLTPQGIAHDRTFVLCHRKADGSLDKLQLAGHPECALFGQEIVDGTIHVRYHAPETPIVPRSPLHDETLAIPLTPDTAGLDREDVNVHMSMVRAYKMGSKYDEWFTACFGFDTVLLYIGDQKRPILGTFSPKAAQPQKGWLSSVASYVTGSNREEDWLTFADCAPYLIATEASLRNVKTRLESGEVDMVKFRPNIVVDGETQWDEDYWSELSLNGGAGFTLSKLCGRCTSVNVDYDTGRPAAGESGTVLKKLTADRRVDEGHKYSPVFGRYAFLTDGVNLSSIALGDEVNVTKRSEQRPVWDWPMKDPAAARFYEQRV